MNTRILLLAISAAALSSCSTMYKSGQTPDDVYYSPGQERVASTETDRGSKSGQEIFRSVYGHERPLPADEIIQPALVGF